MPLGKNLFVIFKQVVYKIFAVDYPELFHKLDPFEPALFIIGEPEIKNHNLILFSDDTQVTFYIVLKSFLNISPALNPLRAALSV